MSSSTSKMGLSDYLGFASMSLLLLGAVNWGVVAIRYASDSLPDFVDAFGESFDATTAINITGHDLYKHAPTPDLLDLISASPVAQMVVYWAVFAAGLVYFGLFLYNSIELRDAK